MTSKQFKKSLVISLVLVLAVFFFGTANAADSPERWRLQSVWSANSNITPALKKMCENITKRSGGKLEVKFFGTGEIVGSVEAADALRNGVIEMACTSGIYNSAKTPEGLIEFGLPFGLENPERFKEFWYKHNNGENFKLVKEAYRERGVELVYINASTSYGYITKFPVNSINDFKGKKIRSFGFFGAVVAYMGGSPVSLPNEDQYLALQQGTVDGTIFPYLSMETMKFKDVSSHLVLPPPLGCPTSDIIVSAKAFDALTPELQKIIYEEAVIQNESYLSVEGTQEADLIANPDKYGIVVNRIPDEEIKVLRQKCTKIWDNVGKKNERTKKLIANLKAFIGVEEK